MFFSGRIDLSISVAYNKVMTKYNHTPELLLPAADASLALRGFRLLAESYPEDVSYKEMNDYGK